MIRNFSDNMRTPQGKQGTCYKVYGTRWVSEGSARMRYFVGWAFGI